MIEAKTALGIRRRAGALIRGLLWSTAMLLLLHCQMIAQTTKEQIARHYGRAEAALRAGDPRTAAEEFREILTVDPENAEASANLGVIAYRSGKFAESKKRFDAALKHNPALWDAKAFLGLIATRTGDADGGTALLTEAFPHIRNQAVKVDAGVAIIQYHQERKTLQKITGVIHDLADSNPDNPEVLYIVYRAYSDLASEALASLSKKAPDSGRVYQIEGEAAMVQDDFPGAIARFRRAVEVDPQIPGIHYELGRAILTNSQDPAALQDAQRQFEAALKANPGDFNSAYELGEVFRLASNPQSAQEQFERVLQLRPDFASADVGLGEILMGEGKAAEAIPHLITAVREDPDNDTAHYRLAMAYRAVGRTQDAAKEMLEVQRIQQPKPKTGQPPS